MLVQDPFGFRRNAEQIDCIEGLHVSVGEKLLCTFLPDPAVPVRLDRERLRVALPVHCELFCEHSSEKLPTCCSPLAQLGGMEPSSSSWLD
jgi:hypothetical protein